MEAQLKPWSLKMESAAEYMLRTESAIRLLFSGIDTYLSILRKANGVTFVTGKPYGPLLDEEFAKWQLANTHRLAEVRMAEHEFMCELFALDTLCGSVLQVAEKAIEIYGTCDAIPRDLPSTVKAKHSKFCVGRTIRTVPLGLIIYAARNQHTHFNDDELREPSISIFRRLSTACVDDTQPNIVDPAFDLSNNHFRSFASNVTSLMGWRSYASYSTDMRALLRI